MFTGFHMHAVGFPSYSTAVLYRIYNYVFSVEFVSYSTMVRSSDTLNNLNLV